MDVLSGVSLDWLRALTWLAAIGSGILLCFSGSRRVDLAALGAVVVHAVANIGAGIYVLSHLRDARWSGGAENLLSVPPLAGTPVIGQFLGPLDTVLSGVVREVNGLLDVRAALPVAMEFFHAAGWALLAALPLAVLAPVISYGLARRRQAEFARYKLQIGELREELDELKRHLGYPG